MSIDNAINELTEAVKDVRDLIAGVKGQLDVIGGEVEKTLETVNESIKTVSKDVGGLTNTVQDRASQVPDGWLFYLVIIFLMLLLLILTVFILSKIGFNTHQHIRSGHRPEKVIYEDERGRYFQMGTPKRLSVKREKALHRLDASGDLEKRLLATAPPEIAV